MEERISVIDKPVVRTVLLFAMLFLIGFATRFPALILAHIYALHGVLAAPFFAAVAFWHFRRGGTVPELFAATLALAAVLGAMNLVMGLSFLLLALCLLAVSAFLLRVLPQKWLAASSVLFGALDYPCALAAGVALGSYAFSGETWVFVVVLLVLALALACLAVLLFDLIVNARRRS